MPAVCCDRSAATSMHKTKTKDDVWIQHQQHVSILAELADRIEAARRLELGKTSGFEKQYPQVTRLYFGGWRDTYRSKAGGAAWLTLERLPPFISTNSGRPTTSSLDLLSTTAAVPTPVHNEID